jgi:hypothetical protein
MKDYEKLQMKEMEFENLHNVLQKCVVNAMDNTCLHPSEL